MKSTDHNINNPLKVLDINLHQNLEAMSMPKVVGTISKEEYDLMIIHDPNSIYMVRTGQGIQLYMGDILIEAPEIKNKYYIGINDHNEYVIYMDQNSGTPNYFTGVQNLVPICSYNDAKIAIEKLAEFNKVGSHYDRDRHLYNLLRSYIDKELSTHELIISIMVAFNYKEDPRLQNVIEFAVAHNFHKIQREFPGLFADQIRVLRDNKPESLFVLYSNLYDLMAKYNFFKDKKYQDASNDLNLSTEVTDIVKVLYFKNPVYPTNF